MPAKKPSKTLPSRPASKPAAARRRAAPLGEDARLGLSLALGSLVDRAQGLLDLGVGRGPGRGRLDRLDRQLASRTVEVPGTKRARKTGAEQELARQLAAAAAGLERISQLLGMVEARLAEATGPARKSRKGRRHP